MSELVIQQNIKGEPAAIATTQAQSPAPTDVSKPRNNDARILGMPRVLAHFGIHFDLRLVILGILLAFGITVVSLVVFPEWAESNRTLLVLVTGVVIFVPSFFAAIRKAFGVPLK